MKKFQLLAAISLLFVGCMVSYNLGSMKHYNAACRMSDLIRCYEDKLNSSESDIDDLGCFEELEGIFLWDDAVGPSINLNEYVYCY